MKYLITGGTGSLGRALIKRILKDPSSTVIVYSRDEGKQAKIFKNVERVRCVIGDVRDFKKLNTTMRIHKPDYVIHTAALKRVDDMEFHPDECMKTNVNGSENVAIASLNNDIKKCILISTDKACQPVNVYGSSKFIAERIFTNFDYNSEKTIFASVRYGNVIASRGSFIPLWIDQIAELGEVTVTSMECSRFLFTLDDAVSTVLSSLDHTQGGEVFIPKINSFSMETILESIKEITKVSDLKTKIIGMRPGEKLHEDMLARTELPFTVEASKELLAVLPQYTRKNHSYSKKYEGKEFNSSLHLNESTEELVSLIAEGLKIAG
jgi:UDP-N-acetylglucosamine 4,6-dehydratase